jgi:hypothetical protein
MKQDCWKRTEKSYVEGLILDKAGIVILEKD